jgi:hypothetical protein
LTVSARLVNPSPERICSFSTTRIPDISRRTVFGAGLTGIVRPTPRVPPTTAFSNVVEPVAVSPPHGPETWADERTVVASIVNSGRRLVTSIARPLTVAVAAASGLAGAVPVAVTVRTPVLRIWPVKPDVTVTDARLLETLYGGAAVPDAVGTGPLVTVIPPPTSGRIVKSTDSPKEELDAVVGCA